MIDIPKPDSSYSAIEVRQLCKEFGGLKAVDGISFELKRGEFLSIFGPNGAGKTTLIKVLTGLIGIRYDLGGRDFLKFAL